MSKRRLRPAVEIVSDIGALAHDLQQHGDVEIVEAVKFCRTANPEIFAWLVSVLSSFRSRPQSNEARTNE
jgi:hypothetical protein